MILLFIFFCTKAKLLRLDDRLCARITGHDDNGILEIYFASLGICNMPVIQHLK